MAKWAEFETETPELAQVAARLWPAIVALDHSDPLPQGAPRFAISYLATVRRDGAPRLHPFCPILAGGRLFAAMLARHPKGGIFEETLAVSYTRCPARRTTSYASVPPRSRSLPIR